MKADLLLDRIVVNPHVMVGKPIVHGTRLTVEYILNLMAHGATVCRSWQNTMDCTHNIQACLYFSRPNL